MHTYHSLILGAGAAGLHAAAFAVKGGNVLVIDHAPSPGEKIRISGGGRCNFTNLNTTPEKFISENPHFAKSALARYSEWDFVQLVRRHGIPFHEKAHGQLFCDTSAKDIVNMLLAEMRPAELRLCTSAVAIDRTHDGFEVTLSNGGAVLAKNLVVATGGKSIPKMGATGVGYRIAEDFGHRVTETRPGLVPLTFDPRVLERLAPLAGVSLPVRASSQGASFDEAMLFTHRGLSGPAILQLSSYWREGGEIEINLSPETDPFERLRAMRAENGRRAVATALSTLLPARLAADIATRGGAQLQPRRPVRPAAPRDLGQPQPLAAAPSRHRGLPHRRGDRGRGLHQRPQPAHHGIAHRAGAVLHRRGGGRDRVARRLQLSVGLVLGLRRRHRDRPPRRGAGGLNPALVAGAAGGLSAPHPACGRTPPEGIWKTGKDQGSGGKTFRASSTREAAVTTQSAPKAQASVAKAAGQRQRNAKKAMVSAPSSSPPVK
jgi:predicted Rossmann fold flavoprotein